MKPGFHAPGSKLSNLKEALTKATDEQIEQFLKEPIASTSSEIRSILEDEKAVRDKKPKLPPVSDLPCSPFETILTQVVTDLSEDEMVLLMVSIRQFLLMTTTNAEIKEALGANT